MRLGGPREGIGILYFALGILGKPWEVSLGALGKQWGSPLGILGKQWEFSLGNPGNSPWES